VEDVSADETHTFDPVVFAQLEISQQPNMDDRFVPQWE